MRPEKIKHRIRVQHALDAISFIQKVTTGIVFEEFKNDYKCYYACLFQFTIVGETINRMDAGLLERFDYPWHKVRAFRNFILHEYHSIDEKMVWDTIKIVLPELRIILEEVLMETK